MKTKNLIPTTLMLSTAFLMYSCMARKDYQRPSDLTSDAAFRTDFPAKDSVSVATVSWKDIFTDPSLQKLIEKALQNNLDLKTALQNINIADAYLKQSKAAYFPTINAGPNYTFSTPSLNSSQGLNLTKRSTFNQFDITANVGWDLDIWGKLKANQKAQLANYFGTIAAQQSIQSDLVASIATNYYQLLAYDEQKKIITETIELRKKSVETTKALKDAGNVTEVAVQQSEALIYNAQGLLTNIDIQIQTLENALSLLQGEAPHAIERSSLETQKLPSDFKTGYPMNLLSNRPDVKQAEFALQYAFELTNNAKAQFYPSLRITGSGGIQSMEFDKLFSANSLFANVIGSLAAPILNGRQIRTNYEVSLANQQKSYLNFKKTLLNAESEVSNAMKIFSMQDDFIQLKEKELAANNKAVDYSKELMNYGMSTYLDVLTADVNRLNAELNIVNAKYTKLSAGVELYRALGGGWK